MVVSKEQALAEDEEPRLYTNRLRGQTVSVPDGDAVLDVTFGHPRCQVTDSGVNDPELSLSLSDLRPRGDGVELMNILVSSWTGPDSLELLQAIGAHDGQMMCVPTTLLLTPPTSEADADLIQSLTDEDFRKLLRVFYPGVDHSHTEEEGDVDEFVEAEIEAGRRPEPVWSARRRWDFTGHHTKILAFHYYMTPEKHGNSTVPTEWVRLVITSANFNTEHWHYSSENVWVRDIPLATAPSLRNTLCHSFGSSFARLFVDLLPQASFASGRRVVAEDWLEIFFRARWSAGVAENERCVVSLPGFFPSELHSSHSVESLLVGLTEEHMVVEKDISAEIISVEKLQEESSKTFRHRKKQYTLVLGFEERKLSILKDVLALAEVNEAPCVVDYPRLTLRRSAAGSDVPTFIECELKIRELDEDHDFDVQVAARVASLIRIPRGRECVQSRSDLPPVMVVTGSVQTRAYTKWSCLDCKEEPVILVTDHLHGDPAHWKASQFATHVNDIDFARFAPNERLYERHLVRGHQKILFQGSAGRGGWLYAGSHNYTEFAWGWESLYSTKVSQTHLPDMITKSITTSTTCDYDSAAELDDATGHDSKNNKILEQQQQQQEEQQEEDHGYWQREIWTNIDTREIGVITDFLPNEDVAPFDPLYFRSEWNQRHGNATRSLASIARVCSPPERFSTTAVTELKDKVDACKMRMFLSPQMRAVAGRLRYRDVRKFLPFEPKIVEPLELKD
ncbi:unnamed protein product [Amoebophrya sp. A25]|nr:unnamed protein product [Amoebophrya sp. A25]|eukprot:GSA25T00026786001.1